MARIFITVYGLPGGGLSDGESDVFSINNILSIITFLAIDLEKLRVIKMLLVYVGTGVFCVAGGPCPGELTQVVVIMMTSCIGEPIDVFLQHLRPHLCY